MNDKQINQWFNTVIQRTKRRVLLRNTLLFLPMIGALSFASFLVFDGFFKSLIVMLISVVVIVVGTLKSREYSKINPSTIAQHLNFNFPVLQESAQLFLVSPTKMSMLQQLQKQRVLSSFEQVITGNNPKLISPIFTRFVGYSWMLTCAVVGTLWVVLSVAFKPHVASPSNSLTQPITTPINIKPMALLSQQVRVVPPTYTQLEEFTTKNLNVSAIEGSTLFWQFSIDSEVDELYVVFSNQQKLRLTKNAQGFYIGSSIFLSSDIYRIQHNEKRVSDVFTVNITKDNPPEIRFVTPKITISSIAKNGQVIIDTDVIIHDDFDLTQVEILASVAKGSGESVKFRDTKFNFDEQLKRENNNHYLKQWNLRELGMEPGDELYFTVNATDNKQPKPQLTKSETKIIRWLDEDQQQTLSDGVVIDFIPEYFKSQRQIIIETIELIAAEKSMSKEEFSHTSRELGIAQTHLKDKYGQYLGAEIDDGGGEHEHGESTGSKSSDHKDLEHEGSEHEEHQEENDGKSEEHPHVGNTEHGGETVGSFGIDRSGRQSQINRFGHQHEDADIGVITSTDPKALMKRAIANMWQAELFLMLYKPEQALPYEKEALKYLKKAKKADRIYVKRLGFEPPPVSESRRYQGELSDIVDHKRIEKMVVDNTEQKQLREFHSLLVSIVGTQRIDALLKQTGLLSQIKRLLTSKVASKPELLKSLALIETMMTNIRTNDESTTSKNNGKIYTSCDLCASKVASAIWQLIPTPEVKATHREVDYQLNDSLLKQYNQQKAGEQ